MRQWSVDGGGVDGSIGRRGRVVHDGNMKQRLRKWRDDTLRRKHEAGDDA